MKKTIFFVLILFLSGMPLKSNALDVKPLSVAILDTAINSNLSVFKDKIIHEVCILEYKFCPNKSRFMQGPKSAYMPLNLMSRNGFDHGTKMSHAAILTNPDIKIVFIRIIGSNKSGQRLSTSESAFRNALKWVNENADKFNIKSVAISQGSHNFSESETYCHSTPDVESEILNLGEKGIPVFIAAGNMHDTKRVSWPGCIKDAVTISSVSSTGEISHYTNFDKNITDFFALGKLKLINSDGYFFYENGTSVATQIASSIYLGLKAKNPELNMNQVIDIMRQRSYQINNSSFNGFILHKGIVNE